MKRLTFIKEMLSQKETVAPSDIQWLISAFEELQECTKELQERWVSVHKRNLELETNSRLSTTQQPKAASSVFTVLSIDHKESWDDYASRIDLLEKAGLVYTEEVFSFAHEIDERFLVLTNDESLLAESDDLVRIGYFDLIELTGKDGYSQSEWAEVTERMLVGFSEIEKIENGELIHFHLFDGRKRTYFHLDWT